VPVTAASQPHVAKIRGWKPQSLATKDSCLYIKSSIPASNAAVLVQLFVDDIIPKNIKPLSGSSFL
jgi:hypothetical protein